MKRARLFFVLAAMLGMAACQATSERTGAAPAPQTGKSEPGGY